MNKEEIKTEKGLDRKQKERRVSFSSILAVILLIVGFSVLLYPTISDWWNTIHESRAIMHYDTAVSEMSADQIETVFQNAEEYNTEFKKLQFPFEDYEQMNKEYFANLDVTGTGIMGYVSIPCIGVELPIYHGTSDAVLNKAVGHLQGSTLPIGGESTHAVVSAHRGLPSARLFTDLDDVKPGDIFTVTILNRVMTYEVDQILIVEPTQLEALNVVQGEDYMTLVTCTPYGINTHRLFVRGKRIENAGGNVHVHADAFAVPAYVVIPVIAIPTLLIILILMLILTGKRFRYEGYDGEISLRDIRKEEEKTDSDSGKE